MKLEQFFGEFSQNYPRLIQARVQKEDNDYRGYKWLIRIASIHFFIKIFSLVMERIWEY